MAKEKEFTYEMLMQSFKESREEMERMQKKSEKEWAEIREKSEKEWAEIRENQKETDEMFRKIGERIDNTNRSVSGIDRSNGFMAEEMIYNSLERNMTFAGITFDDIDRNVKLHSKFLDIKGEFDVILKNGDTLAIIETKYKVKREDISKLVDKQVKNFRKLFPTFSEYEIVLGIGGMSFEDKAIDDANKKGVGIIKIVGDKLEFYTDGLKRY